MPTFQITWLGCAGVLINTNESSVLIDPFVSRPSFLKVALGIPFEIDHKKIDQTLSLVELKKNRAIIVGHSHYDHACDAPFFAQKASALFFGSSSSLYLTKAAQLKSEQIQNIEQIKFPYLLGDQKISFIKSKHGPAFFGRIPYVGEINKDLIPPLRANQYREGGTSIIEINCKQTVLWHVGSAGYLSENLTDKKCDILLLTIVGIENIDAYIENLVVKTKAKIIIPIHFDNMFAKISSQTKRMPFLKVENIIKKLEKTGAKVILPPHLVPIAL